MIKATERQKRYLLKNRLATMPYMKHLSIGKASVLITAHIEKNPLPKKKKSKYIKRKLRELRIPDYDVKYEKKPEMASIQLKQYAQGKGIKIKLGDEISTEELRGLIDSDKHI